MPRATLPIALAITSFDPGGTERQMTELICRLDPARFAVHVVCLRREGLWLPRVERVAASVTEFRITGFRSASTATQVRRFARWCRDRRIAVLHACDFYANIFGLAGGALARVPLRIGSRRDLTLPQRSSSQHRLQRWSYRLAHCVVANSRAAARQLRREAVPAGHIAIIPNGIDLSRYTPPPPRSQRRVITTVANLRGEKGHDVLLRAIAIVAERIADVRVQIVGDGPMRALLGQQAHTLGLSHAIDFLGHREDVPEVLQQSDIFVLPSRTEAFPNSLLEAMAAGLPVVASDTGGIPELIDDGRNGLLVPVGDHRALAAALLRTIETPDEAAALGHAARHTIDEGYSFTRMVAAFESLYLRAAAGTGPRIQPHPLTQQAPADARRSYPAE